MESFCFIASLHTTSFPFRLFLRRLSSYLSVFYFILNAYVLWWSNNEINLFNNTFLSIFLIRLLAIIYFLVSSGFCLDLFLILSCQLAFYLSITNFILDLCIFYQSNQSNEHFWLLLDYIIDDIAIICGYFYLYQFNLYQRKQMMK